MGATGRNASNLSLETMGGGRLDAWLQRKMVITQGAKVGGTAGWVVGAANNIGRMATCPASQTGSKLVVPAPRLRIGDTIRSFNLYGQIESAGGAVTLDAELRKLTGAAADLVDATIASMTQLAVTADTLVSALNAEKASLAELIAENATYYFILTATTAASTDIDLQGIGIVSY